MYEYMYICMYESIYVYVCMYVYLCMYVCVSMYVCKYICVCMYAGMYVYEEDLSAFKTLVYVCILSVYVIIKANMSECMIYGHLGENTTRPG